MSALTIGSLFSGIGGLELGLEWAGLGPTLWQVEQSEYCRAVLAKHWPDATRYEDVRHAGGSTLAPVDVICGGFPCQDVSNAGRRAGLTAGTRSGLWYEFSRIIRELRPRYVVVENVAALLTLGLDAVLGELAESGYDAEWDCVPASAVGAPHQRDRIFVVAYAAGEQHEGRASANERTTAAKLSVMADAAGDRRTERGAGDEGRHADSAGRISVRGESRGSGADRRALADTARNGRCEGVADSRRGSARDGARPEHRPLHGDRWWRVEPDVGRVAHGVPARVDRLRALGNAVVPQVAEVVGRLIVERERALQERAA